MKTKLLLAVLIPFSFNFIFSQCPATGYTCISDSNFEQALVTLGIDSDNMVDGRVLTSDISDETSLVIPLKSISDLTGIEDFTSLQTLNCWGNPLGTLDLTSNTNLVNLYCYNCQLTSLTLPSSTSLNYIDCYNNQLTDLVLTGAINLATLQCYSNPNLGNLNVNANTKLTTLDCSNTGLTGLNVTNNVDLLALRFGQNSISTIDLSMNTALIELQAQFNTLTELDVTNNTMLTTLYCYLNPSLISLDVSNTTQLNRLYGYESGLQYLNVKNGHNDLLDRLWVYTNSLTCIQVEDVNQANNKTNWQKDAMAEYMLSCPSLGLENFDLANLSLYPNPTNSVVKIQLDSRAKYRLLDVKGGIFFNGYFDSGVNELDMSSLSDGFYVLHVENEEGRVAKKIIKY